VTLRRSSTPFMKVDANGLRPVRPPTNTLGRHRGGTADRAAASVTTIHATCVFSFLNGIVRPAFSSERPAATRSGADPLDGRGEPEHRGRVRHVAVTQRLLVPLGDEFVVGSDLVLRMTGLLIGSALAAGLGTSKSASEPTHRGTTPGRQSSMAR
jgi:hypothetical protein